LLLRVADDPITADFVVAALEDATRTMRAMQSLGHSTAMVGTWADDVAMPGEVEEVGPRPPPPSAEKIQTMDIIMRWLAYIPQHGVRRIVAMRSITHPLTEKPTAWAKIARAVGWNYRAVKVWHARGIDAIVLELNAPA
jgi:hypothetical protein